MTGVGHLKNLKTSFMKTMVVLIAAAMFYCGCATEKEVQVEMVNAELVAIDTVQRYDSYEQVLTWKCSDNIRYVSFEPMSKYFKVGTILPVMLKR